MRLYKTNQKANKNTKNTAKKKQKKNIKADIRMGLINLDGMINHYTPVLRGKAALPPHGRRTNHPKIFKETEARVSKKFGDHLIYALQSMKPTHIDTIKEIMKQNPDFNATDPKQRTALRIALDRTKQNPAFAFVSRYIAL